MASSTTDLVSDDVMKKDNLNSNSDETKATFKEMNLQQRLAYVKEIVTVEPLIACYIMATVLYGPAMVSLEFEKACRVNLGYNDTVCDAVLSGEYENFTVENDNVQVVISDVHSWQNPLQSVMPIILILFLGSYSDKYKLRKPFLLLPLLGECFAVIGCLLCVAFMREWSLEIQGISYTVIPSFFGGMNMIIMAMFAYIADVSTLEMRTLRVGIIQITMNVCFPAMQALSGLLFERIGYTGILSISLTILVIGIAYGYLGIKEPTTPIDVDKKTLLADIFDPKLAVETFRLLFEKRPGNDRSLLICVMFILFISNGVAIGEYSLLYLYLQNGFQWTPVQSTYFITVNTIVHLFGTALAVPLFTRVFKFSDIVILILSFIDKILSNVFFLFAKTATLLYVSIIVSIVTGVTAIAIRSLATKTVSQDDLGKAQALFGMCDAIAVVVAVPVYNKAIYVQTLEAFPAAFFSVGIVLIGFLILLLLLMNCRRKNKANDEDNKNTINGKNTKYNEGHVNVAMEEIQTTHM